MEPNRKLTLSALIIALTFLVAILVQTHPWESAADRAHRLCSECGLPAAEIDWLIETFRGVDRQEALNSFYATFDDPKGAEPCEPCANALLDAAEKL